MRALPLKGSFPLASIEGGRHVFHFRRQSNYTFPHLFVRGSGNAFHRRRHVRLTCAGTCGAHMTVSFPNPARSYDEAKQRIRFLGHDGMFEVKFFMNIEALALGRPFRDLSEADYLKAFDAMRAKILKVAERLYKSRGGNAVNLELSDF
ncbi:DUF1488 domain-containing protein [Rhizobium sp. 32-5/1]|uniref:DUF1488 domain-containing protein n=1 Tax=Rhizobium sp. 32-5/1 TaxID=3019602 RepID=UPI0032B7EDB8